MAEETVLTPDDWRFFHENGYVVIHDAVPPENLRAVVEIIWEFLGMDPGDPEDWYRPPLRHGGMVELYQHQALWDNRQHPRVYQIFSEILGTDRLWVSIDRVSMKPPRHPAHPEYDHAGFIHWDVDPTQSPVPFGVQGVLCLTDTAANQGGFQCVPGIHKRAEQWVREQPPQGNPRYPEIDGLDVVSVPGRAGDLIIWDRLLLHGNGHNTSNRPRLAQYITMYPADEEDEAARERRVELWRNRLCPGGPPYPGDPRRVEELQYQTAELTPLGRQLLGLDRWD